MASPELHGLLELCLLLLLQLLGCWVYLQISSCSMLSYHQQREQQHHQQQDWHLSQPAAVCCHARCVLSCLLQLLLPSAARDTIQSDHVTAIGMRARQRDFVCCLSGFKGWERERDGCAQINFLKEFSFSPTRLPHCLPGIVKQGIYYKGLSYISCLLQQQKRKGGFNPQLTRARVAQNCTLFFSKSRMMMPASKNTAPAE